MTNTLIFIAMTAWLAVLCGLLSWLIARGSFRKRGVIAVSILLAILLAYPFTFATIATLSYADHQAHVREAMARIAAQGGAERVEMNVIEIHSEARGYKEVLVKSPTIATSDQVIIRSWTPWHPHLLGAIAGFSVIVGIIAAGVMTIGALCFRWLRHR
jgi:hypothetical protein